MPSVRRDVAVRRAERHEPDHHRVGYHGSAAGDRDVPVYPADGDPVNRNEDDEKRFTGMKSRILHICHEVSRFGERG